MLICYWFVIAAAAAAGGMAFIGGEIAAQLYKHIIVKADSRPRDNSRFFRCLHWLRLLPLYLRRRRYCQLYPLL